ncbi:hypothetical protein LTR85_005141 [Meristemomyces frigidus]|nr:hypothetical protein LTR85_005141 [Meristemomyces frigidus]
MGYNFTYCNTTLEDQTIHEVDLWKGGLTFHHLGLFLAAVFGLISIFLALYLVFRHATHYLRPWEQKHIIRILLMIPVYSIVSFLSFVFYKKAVYFQVLGDCYEAFAIASFFTLLCHYVAPDLHEQKEYFRQLNPIQNWFWGVFGLQKCTGGQNKGPFRKPRSGLTWFNIIWIGVFQYCLIRVMMTITSVVTQEFGQYCEASLSPVFAHVWVTAIECVSVSIAMFCLIQFYLQLRIDLADHKPFLKVLCIKLVIFFSFWQTILISLLSSGSGPLQPTNKIAYQDIKVGIPSVMLCIEMAIFSVMHLFAFPWKEYRISSDPLTMTGAGYSGGEAKYKGGPMGMKAMMDAFNPWDIIKASARGFRWLFVGYRHRTEDISYQGPHKLDGNTGYMGPTYAGGLEPATELRPSDDGGRGRTDTLGTELGEDDRAGLLRHSAIPARVPSESPYRTYTNDEFASGDDSEHLDLGANHRLHPAATSSSEAPNPAMSDPKASEYGSGRPQHEEFEEEDDTGYHPGVGPGGVHPALRDDGVQQWDHWAGAQRPGDADSMRPPTYRTQDPRR